MRLKPSPLTLLLQSLPLGASLVYAQCQNYGIQNGSSCACPVGFGGDTCTQLACGGNIFQGAQRQLTPSSGTSANLTSAGCNCQSDWTGTGCNVCQSATACQNAFSGAGGSLTALTSNDGGLNNTMVCNASPNVWAAGQMSCQVNNPTIKAVFPKDTTINLMRTLTPSLSPLPNITSFGTGDSNVLAQLFYVGVEQFYCSATGCTQSNSSSSSNDWHCPELHCTCVPGATFCGGEILDLTSTINGLQGPLDLSCGTGSDMGNCKFQQSVLSSVFGNSGLALSQCQFGECVRQSVIDGFDSTAGASSSGGDKLSGGVIAGLAVVGGLLGLALAFLAWGLVTQRRARRGGDIGDRGSYGIGWKDVSYIIPGKGKDDDKTILDLVSGNVRPGEMMAVLGPSGAGKTTLVEILAGKRKSGVTSGLITYPSSSLSSPLSSPSARQPRISFVPQTDILPPLLTVHETLTFAAKLRLPESMPPEEKALRVEALMGKLGIADIRNSRIGDADEGGKRGISGGERRRVSIGVELIAGPEVLVLDEPTSGLDSVSASRVAKVLYDIAHDPDNPTAVIASIHQPSSQLYATFDSLLLLAHGHALYTGAGGLTPVGHFKALEERGVRVGVVWREGYNVADYLLEVASEASVGVFGHAVGGVGGGSESQSQNSSTRARGGGLGVRESDTNGTNTGTNTHVNGSADAEKDKSSSNEQAGLIYADGDLPVDEKRKRRKRGLSGVTGRKGTGKGKGNVIGGRYAATFLTQLQVLCGREWKVLKRDRTLFITHVGVAGVLGVFCGGLYFHTGKSIAGFQSRVGCLFFLGALIAFSTLSALYNVVVSRPLFLRERSNSYYSPTAWLLSRFIFDVVPLRIVPSIIVASITYWMTGLAHEAANFFKFLFIIVLYTLAMTLYNFLLGAVFENGGVAILLSALSALYQMTFAGFFVHLDSIPPVLRWLQWLCPLKYTLEALSVNEVGVGLQIEDTLEGVPVNVSASLIMQLLFGFVPNSYYRDVLVLFGFIAGFAIGVVAVVWFRVRESR